MGISGGVRRLAAPVGTVVNTKLEALFKHITNEAQGTRETLTRRIDDLGRETRLVHDQMHEVVNPAMDTVAEASTLLQHAALRVERRLAELTVATGETDGLAGFAATRGAVEVSFALAALGRPPAGSEVVILGQLPLLALLTAAGGYLTTLVGVETDSYPGVRTIGEEVGWNGPSSPAALVVRSLTGAMVAGDVERLQASARWVGSGGRLVLVAPAGGRRPRAEMDGALANLVEEGWDVSRRAAATRVDGCWKLVPAAAASGDLVLVELTRAMGAS